MLRRSLAALVVALFVGGIVVADDIRGTIVKIDSDSITIMTDGKFNKEEKKLTKGEEKTFKFSAKDIKVNKAATKDKDAKDAVELTLSELKTAIKVTTVRAKITFEGETASAIETGGGFGGRQPMKDKGKGKDKKKDDKKDDQ